MSKLSFRARALDASKPMPIYLAEELPDLPDYSAINRAVPQMPSGMEKEEESEHHLQRAISGTGLIIPTPEVCQVSDLEFYERCYPPDYKMPKQHIHMQPLWEEQEAPEYDIDSEDERWLKQQRHPELTELKFEQMMDKLEKSSGQTVVTLNEAKLLLERQDDLVIAVYDYWLNKRLNTQHPLILSVKTESRPGQSSNNPYLAFRRRTEKMQTRKNRKNDESSYEKMLKLRRDLARALTLLELVARREKVKRELVRLTARLADKRYAAGDFASQLLPDPPPRAQYTSAPISSSGFRREQYSAPHYPPRAPPTPVDQPRQREKRSYKRLKYRHHAVGTAQRLRDSGVYTSSEEESGPRTEAPSPPDDGPFAFRRKPGCYYEMPTSTLCGDPVDPDDPSKEGLYDHELDERYRYTLTSIKQPYPRCVGFARRRLARGGRVALDRVPTPLDSLWPTIHFAFPDSTEYKRERDEEVELETKAHRTPKEMTRDYHTGGKYPWRHAFRRHLNRHPELWTVPLKQEPEDNAKTRVNDSKDEKMCVDIKCEETLPDVKSDISVSASTIDKSVRSNLISVMRKRSWSGCSDGSYDSDESLQPVEVEFEKFISEVNKKWLHFRPKTPPPSPPQTDKHDDQLPIAMDTPIAVELRLAEGPPSAGLEPFTTSEFTLGDLYPEINPEDTSLDISNEDLLNENFGLTEAQVESILSETDLKALADVDLTKDDKKIGEDILEELVKDVEGKDPFLLQGQGLDGRAGSGRRRREAALGSSSVSVVADRELMYVDKRDLTPPHDPPIKIETPKQIKVEEKPVIEVPKSKIIVEEVNEVPQIKVERKKKEENVEEIQLSGGVQLKSVQSKQSPLKKHIITAGRRPSDISTDQPQILTVAVSDSLKVRLQNHLLSTQSGVLVQNGPFPPVAVAVPVQSASGTVTAGTASHASPRRVSAPLVHLTGTTLAHKPLQIQQHTHVGHTHTPVVVSGAAHTLHHVAPNKLKVLHAHPLTHSQKAQLLAQNRAIAQLPAVVSLQTLADAKGGALLKAAPGSVAQYIEIKQGALGKGHLVNVLRHPAPQQDARKRHIATPQDNKGIVTAAAPSPRPHKLSVSLDGRQLVRATLPTPALRHQIAVRGRHPAPSTSVGTPRGTAPHSVVANLLQRNVRLGGAHKIAISAPGGAAQLAANVQAIAFSAAAAQLKARQLKTRPAARVETTESTAPAATGGQTGGNNVNTVQLPQTQDQEALASPRYCPEPVT